MDPILTCTKRANHNDSLWNLRVLGSTKLENRYSNRLSLSCKQCSMISRALFLQNCGENMTRIGFMQWLQSFFSPCWQLRSARDRALTRRHMILFLLLPLTRVLSLWNTPSISSLLGISGFSKLYWTASFISSSCLAMFMFSLESMKNYEITQQNSYFRIQNSG